MSKKDDSNCDFDLAWRGKVCKEKATCGSKYCKDHQKKCRSCGREATHECDQTVGPMVCGAPLCDGCEHVHNQGDWFKHAGKGDE